MTAMIVIRDYKATEGEISVTVKHWSRESLPNFPALRLALKVEKLLQMPDCEKLIDEILMFDQPVSTKTMDV